MKKLFYITIILSIIIGNIDAQPGAIDTTFNIDDYGFGSGNGANDVVSAIAFQNDGKIIIGGSFESYNATSRKHLARLNLNGSIDLSFDPGTVADGGTVQTIAVQENGKIIIGGHFYTYNGTDAKRIARLNTDGSLDYSFDMGSGFSNFTEAIQLQNDGKIVVGGAFSTYNGSEVNSIARLNTDGTLDTSFSQGTGANHTVKAIAIQNDGKIIIAGRFSDYNGISRNRIARLNADGTIDSTFLPGLGANDKILSVVIQNDGKIIIGGMFTEYDGIQANRIARLNENGSLDETFNSGTGASSWVRKIAIQDDEKIILGGDFLSYNGIPISGNARLNIDGSLDTTFDNGTGTGDWVFSTALQSDGKIVVGGWFSTYNGLTAYHITRLNNDGSMDNSFNPLTGASSRITSAFVQDDGKIIIGGFFNSFNGTKRRGIARINSNGSLDQSFDPGSGANDYIYTAVVQDDGKTVIGGYFTEFNGVESKYLTRLNQDGSSDESFMMGTGPGGSISNANLQQDGKIIVTGSFQSFNGIARNRIARLNTDGSLDSSFDINGYGPNNYLLTTAIQNDGKIIIGGFFTLFNGISRSKIARLNSNGDLDITFDPQGIIAGYAIRAIAIQDDGKIIIGGDFTTFSGANINNVARLNEDGSLDNTFNTGIGANGTVRSITVQFDGKIIIGGNFTEFNGIERNRIARINSDGSLDETFISEIGANSEVLTLSLQNDGKIIAAGSFTSYNGTGKNRIARIIGGDTPVGITTPKFEKEITIYPVPFSNQLIIEIDENDKYVNIEILNAIGQVVFRGGVINKTMIQTNHLNPGIYLVKIENPSNQQSKSSTIIKKIIKN
jgi:uncharacterized delta-60 repeat protein